MRVNGGTPVGVWFASSGGFDALAPNSLPVALRAGENVIEISNDTWWAPDLDRIEVE